MKKIIYLFILISQLSVLAWGEQSFVIRRIEIKGLQHISVETVETYLPIKRGETLTPSKTSVILRTLYKTGFFEHISLSRSDNTLNIYVTERPVIGQLKISGNSVIQTDKLTTVMRSMEIAEGRVYNAAMLDRIKQSLLNQYYQLGRYNARVNVQVTPLPRNRVAVTITISEGLVAKIRRISIIGNHAFSEATLAKQLDITTTGLLTFFTQTDRYSEEKLETSMEKLRNFYMDHGYLRVDIKSSQAEVTPDRKSVYINIVVDEGQPYTIKGYQLEGELALPRAEFLTQVTIRPGETFSRQKVIDTEKALTKLLGDQGYLFATIALRPDIDDQNHQVSLVFNIKSGKRAYVRQITFSENTRTNDNVLRREMIQMESAPVSTSRLEESKHRLQMLPYLKEVDMSLNPVPNVDDQVDINYKVKEDNAAQASFKIGYSQLNKLILGAGLNQKNFLGTGNTFGLNFQHSRYEQFYSMDYSNPYYTEDGISRSFNFAVSRVDPGAIDRVNSDYITNEFDLGVLYGIPIGQDRNIFNRILAGVTYQNTTIKLRKDKNTEISNQVKTFIKDHGRHFQELDFKLGLSRDSRDRAFFPTKGVLQTLFFDGYAPTDKNSLSFYTLNYHFKWYQPITSQFIFLTRTDFGYANGFRGLNNFPFYKNYFAGGIDTVRGFEDYTLGPRDSKGDAFGGNILIDGSIGLIFPNYISDNLRTTLFADAGNVYSSLDNTRFGGRSSNSGPLRYSVGVEFDWLTPFGPIEISLAHGFSRKGDHRRTFQFALGANF